MPFDRANSLLTIQEAAQYLRFHRSSIYRLMNEDATFPRPVRVGKSLRFFASELDQWVKGCREE